MGADIYLQSEFEPNRAKWEATFNAAVNKRDAHPQGSEMHTIMQRKVMEAYNRMYDVGYYRDAYNPYGLFAQLNLSWWQDVIPLLNKTGFLPIKNARKLIGMVERAKLNPAKALAVAEAQKDDEPEEGWTTHYETDRAGLIAILERSIEKGEPLRCSL